MGYFPRDVGNSWPEIRCDCVVWSDTPPPNTHPTRHSGVFVLSYIGFLLEMLTRDEITQSGAIILSSFFYNCFRGVQCNALVFILFWAVLLWELQDHRYWNSSFNSNLEMTRVEATCWALNPKKISRLGILLLLLLSVLLDLKHNTRYNKIKWNGLK